MPETPKLFQKKSKVKNFFNGLAREVLTGEDLPVRVPSVDTGNTVATSQGYPSLPSDDSESEGDMERPSHPGLDGMEEMRQQFMKWRRLSRKIRMNLLLKPGKNQRHQRHRIPLVE